MAKTGFTQNIFPGIGPRVRFNFMMDAVAATGYATFYSLTIPFLGPLVLRHGGSSFLVGVIAAAPFYGLLSASLWGQLSAKGEKLPWVYLPALACRGLFALTAWVVNPLLFTALVILYFLINGIQQPAYTALVRSIYPDAYRGRLMSLVRLWLTFIQLLALFAAGYLLDVYGQPLSFTLAAVAGVIGAFFFSRIREPRPGHAREEVQPVEQAPGADRLTAVLSQDKTFAYFLTAIAVVGSGNLLAVPVYTLFQVQVLNLSNAQIAFGTIAWSVGLAISYIASGWHIDRTDPLTSVKLAAASYLSVPLIYLIGRNYPAVLLGQAFLGVADAALEMGWMNSVILFNPRRVSVYSGIYLTFLGIRGAIAPLIGSFLATHLGLYFTMGLAATVIVTGNLLMRRFPSKAQILQNRSAA